MESFEDEDFFSLESEETDSELVKQEAHSSEPGEPGQGSPDGEGGKNGFEGQEPMVEGLEGGENTGFHESQEGEGKNGKEITEIKDLSDRYSEMNQEVMDIQDRADDTRENAEQMEKRVQALDERVSQMKGAGQWNPELQSEINDLKRDFRQEQDHMLDAKENIASLENKDEKLQQQSGQAKTEGRFSEDDAWEAQVYHENFQELTRGAQQAIGRAESSLDKLDEGIKDLDSKMYRSREDFNAQEADQRRDKNESIDLSENDDRVHMENLEQIHGQMKENLDAVQHDHHRLEQISSEVKDLSGEDRERVSRLQTEVSGIQEHLQGLEQESKKMEADWKLESAHIRENIEQRKDDVRDVVRSEIRAPSERTKEVQQGIHVAERAAEVISGAQTVVKAVQAAEKGVEEMARFAASKVATKEVKSALQGMKTEVMEKIATTIAPLRETYHQAEEAMLSGHIESTFEHMKKEIENSLDLAKQLEKRLTGSLG